MNNEVFDTQDIGRGAYITSETAPDESSGISLSDIFRTLLRNKWLIAVCTILFFASAVVYIAVKAPIYEAAATIRIDPARAGSLGLSDLLSLAGGGGSGDQIPTEMGILKSDQVTLATLKSLSNSQFSSFAGFDKSQMNFAPADQKLTRAQEGVIGAVKMQVGIKQVEGTQLVSISFRNKNPEIAAVLANDLVQAYIRQSFDSRYNSVSQVRVWLSTQMDELRSRAADSQRKLAEFQEKNNLVGIDPQNNTVVDRLKLLNTRVTMAEGDRIIKEAQLRAAMTGDPVVLSSLFSDPKLQALQAQQGNLYSEYAQLSSKFGSQYQPLIELKKQMAMIDSDVKDNLGNITQRLKEDYDASSRAENMLRQSFDSETQKAFALNRTQADYAVLIAESTSSRDLYDMLQYKLQQAVVDAGLNSVDTMIVDSARVPLDPIEPKKTITLAIGLLFGLATGIGASLLKESISDEIQSIHQVERDSGLVSLATIPHLPSPSSAASKGAAEGGVYPLDIVTLREPRSRMAESYRTLRNSVLLTSIDRPLKTVLITSSLPNEGKSSTSVNYAVVLAQKGAKVLLIDADLRRPTIHKHFRVSNKHGLSSYIVGDDENINLLTPVPEVPSFKLLTAGPDVAFPSEVLGSQKFHSLLKSLEAEFDNIIIDSAPILTVSDTLPLATWTDTVVLVARAGSTPMKALNRTKALLKRAHAKIAGVLLNDISGVGGDSGYYGKGGYDYYLSSRE